MTSCSFHLFSPYFIFSKCAKVIKWSHKSMQHVAKSATSARNQWGTRSGTACWRSSKADVFPRFSIPPSATGILWVIQHRFGMFFSNFYSYFLYGTVVNLFSLFCKRNQSLFLTFLLLFMNHIAESKQASFLIFCVWFNPSTFLYVLFA